MGVSIERSEFTDKDFEHFSKQLKSELTVLADLVNSPGFGVGERSLGAELEICLVDEASKPSHINRNVLATSLDPRVNLELDRFNLEFNTDPVLLRESPLYCASQTTELCHANVAERCGAAQVARDR